MERFYLNLLKIYDNQDYIGRFFVRVKQGECGLRLWEFVVFFSDIFFINIFKIIEDNSVGKININIVQ